MSLFGFRKALIGAGICSVAGLAAAAEEGAGPKISSEIRASLDSSDKGDARTANFKMERLKLQLKGSLDSATDYRLRLDFNGAEVVDFAYGTWWISKTIGFRAGKDKVQQGGIYNMTNGLFDFAKPIYADNKPHATYKPMFDVEMKIAGLVSVQIFDDVSATAVTTPKAQWHTVDQQPAFAVSYVGDINGAAPRVQIGSYDNNHSTYASVGGEYKVGAIDATANYIWDRRSHKDSLTAKDPTDKYDVLTSIELGGKFAVNKQIEPFFSFSMFDHAQEGTDLEVNSVGADKSLNWDDNGMVIGFGSMYHATEHATPFLAIESRRGEFAENLNPASTKTETHMETNTRLGMAVEF